MAIELLASLKFLWDFIKPILSDKVKESLKAETSPERARRQAFTLFQTLEWLCFESGEFVRNLDRLVSVMSGSPTLEQQQAAKESLLQSSQVLSQAILGLSNTVRQLHAQLAIHQPDMAETI